MKRDKPEPERFVMYARGHRPPDIYPRCWVPIFFDPSHARVWLMRMIGKDSYQRDGNVLSFEDGTTITAERLDEVLSAEETNWQLTNKDSYDCLRFRRGSWEEDHSQANVEVITDESGEVKPKKEAKPPKPEKPKIPDGYIKITDWATKWGMNPMHARQALRGSGLQKPEFGWAFDPKDEKKIKKICGVK